MSALTLFSYDAGLQLSFSAKCTLSFGLAGCYAGARGARAGAQDGKGGHLPGYGKLVSASGNFSLFPLPRSWI